MIGPHDLRWNDGTPRSSPFTCETVQEPYTPSTLTFTARPLCSAVSAMLESWSDKPERKSSTVRTLDRGGDVSMISAVPALPSVPSNMMSTLWTVVLILAVTARHHLVRPARPVHAPCQCSAALFMACVLHSVPPRCVLRRARHSETPRKVQPCERRSLPRWWR